ncbi:heterodisulfide reductase-related iron-sulfur binding cluster [Deinococcus sp.]|uniref:(Fe-S)-binding protein n=1 Tax=Deinococcus sp. TaxID=47478 RepID=UPI0025D2B1BB|nr:heterodisulfide reductase-related iron-sulfur binding cluster [Deinococcus sp.]
MLPLSSKIAFFIFAFAFGGLGAWGFYRLYLRIRRGAPATERRFDNLPGRIGSALVTTLTQSRTFRGRTAISVLHSFIFYGFTYYLLVNVVDGLEGYVHFNITSGSPLGAVYNLLADILSFLVLLGVASLLIRRTLLPARRDFLFNGKSLLHPWVKGNYILRDSIIVSSFILFHVGSRVIGQGAKLAMEGTDAWQPFTSTVSHLFSPNNAEFWRVFGYWGALGSVLAFLAYFPYTKHVHIFMAPLNYAFKRQANSGTIPPMKNLEAAMEQDDPKLGAAKLEDLEWPRLLDAYACIQCNRCQDVCPANATGKALSPAALEINKRMELNRIASHASPFTLQTAPFELGAMTELPLLEFAIDEASLWACTTCGACMEVCPVQDEQMLDIIDIRRQQVMVAGEFPPQLQSAFRGMERAQNPWGLSRDKRFEWADGLKVPTTLENPTPDVLYWVGCAASYDPGAQKVARSFVQLLDKAGVNYAVLGKKEACTGDSARRAGNEFLFQSLAAQNVETLNSVQPKLIVATCPHCMNTIGNEYPQLGGHYRTMHHTEYLEMLLASGQLVTAPLDTLVTYHDPCYLGRHNGVYDAPRDVIRAMGSEILELERSREGSFCCGAGGAQFWKEEEAGDERISDNRFKEIQARLDSATENAAAYADGKGAEGKVLAVGCPFCKSMLSSTPTKQERDDIVIKDVAELLLESVNRGVNRASGELPHPLQPAPEAATAPIAHQPTAPDSRSPESDPAAVVGETSASAINAQPGEVQAEPAEVAPVRKRWGQKDAVTPEAAQPPNDDVSSVPVALPAEPELPAAPRKKWGQKDDVSKVGGETETVIAPVETAVQPNAAERPKWKPGAPNIETQPEPVAPEITAEPSVPETKAERPKWKAGAAAPVVQPVPDIQAATEITPSIQVESATPAERPKWKPGAAVQTPSAPPVQSQPDAQATAPAQLDDVQAASPVAPVPPTERPKWKPGGAKVEVEPVDAGPAAQTIQPVPASEVAPPTQPGATTRPKWTPKVAALATETAVPVAETAVPDAAGLVRDHSAQIDTAPSGLEVAPARKKWTPKKPADG